MRGGRTLGERREKKRWERDRGALRALENTIRWYTMIKRILKKSLELRCSIKPSSNVELLMCQT